MPTFTGKTFASFYKNLLGIDQSSNTGVDATPRKIQDGLGNDTVVAIADDNLFVRPVSDNTTETLAVYDKDTNVIFAVDTINSKLKGGSSQTALNTQYAHFAVSSATTTSSSRFNDTNPATSLTISNTAFDVVNAYWYVMDNITIDAVKWLHSADTATGEATAAHLMAYTVDIANGSTSGDLSSGTVVADGATITNAGYEQIYYQSMTIQSADVDAGKVIMFTFAADTVNSDYSISATVKYHIR